MLKRLFVAAAIVLAALTAPVARGHATHPVAGGHLPAVEDVSHAPGA